MDIAIKTKRILKECGAFKDGGHFVYHSGLHGDFYLNKDALYARPLLLDDICVLLTDVAIGVYGRSFDTVLAPAISGILLGQGIAFNLAQHRKDMAFAYADKHVKNKDIRTIRRGYQKYITGKRVLLVDDVVTTGHTLMGMAEAVHALGGEPIGSVVICDRSGVRSISSINSGTGCKHDLRIIPLVELEMMTYNENECPFCKAKRPLDVDLGDVSKSLELVTG